MTVSDSTNELIKNYHDASGRLAAIHKLQHPQYSKEDVEILDRLTVGTRELLTRCLLLDDPRSLAFLIEQTAIILKIVGQASAAEHLESVSAYVFGYFLNHGTL